MTEYTVTTLEEKARQRLDEFYDLVFTKLRAENAALRELVYYNIDPFNLSKEHRKMYDKHAAIIEESK